MISLKNRYRSFGGWTEFYEHPSKVNSCNMRFSIFRPDCDGPCPVLYWLSGLTCTEENFMQKSGIQKLASQAGIVVVVSDTSPRACGIEGEDSSWDYGSGASFYVDATQEPWSKHYQMYSYIVEELPEIIGENFNVDKLRQSISGHSMGGHGALMIGLRNQEKYRSISAFAPISSPTASDWGQRAFQHYLGSDQRTWSIFDTCELLKHCVVNRPILIDQGAEDEFLHTGQLQFAKLEGLLVQRRISARLRLRQGYDHSYYFVASFLEGHMAFHQQHLCS